VTDAPTITWPAAPTDLQSARLLLSFVADHAMRGLINDKQAGAATKSTEAFVRVERYVEQIRALTKEIAQLKRALPKP
jgi:hypothetical protein